MTTIAGLDALRKGLQQAPLLTQQELLAAAEWSTMLMQHELQDVYFPRGKPRDVHPKAKRSPKGPNDTFKTITRDAHATPVGVLGVVGSADPVALFVEEGTRPHAIRAKNARALSWALGAGEFAAVKAVAHPGTKGQYPFKRVGADLSAQIERRFDQAVANVVTHLQAGGA